MHKTLLAAGAAIAILSAPVFGQAHGHAGGAGGVGAGARGGLGGPAASLPAVPQATLPAVPPTTIPPSPNANPNASGQVQGDVHAQTDVHASDRAHTRTGASVDHSATAATGAGVANRSFKIGQRVSANEKFYTDLDDIPSTAKAQIPNRYQTDAYRFIYQPDEIYVVANSSDKVVSTIDLNP